MSTATLCAIDAAPPRAVATDRFSAPAVMAVIACGIGNIIGVTTIVNATFSGFLVPVSGDLGLSRSAFTFVLTLISVLGLVAYPVSGRLIDRFGPRPVALAGNLLFGLSVAGLGLVSAKLWVLYGLFALMGVLATLPGTVLFARVVSTWFFAHRGLVLGLSGGVAFGIGGMIVPPFAEAVMQAWGWRAAYVGLGVLTIAVGQPVFWLWLKEAPRGGPAAAPAALTGLSRAEAMRTPAFWILLVGVAVGAGSTSSVITHMIPLAAERGFGFATALSALSALYAANAIWQTALGALLDRLGMARIAALFVLPGMAGAWLLNSAHSEGQVILGALLVGLSAGTEYGLVPFCIPRYFGFRCYGEIYGVIFGMIMLLQGLAPFLMDLAYDLTGNYHPALAAFSFTLLGCAGVIAFLPRFGPRP
ncbi:MAG TPA: MFS transporter [Novosphingobium sp.]|nr:MFS transporter [Novosphingobium sp.]